MLPLLTDREQQVFSLIADGLTNREVSCYLLISESTVENHIHHIYSKMGFSNRVQAVARAFQLNQLNTTLLMDMPEIRGNPS